MSRRYEVSRQTLYRWKAKGQRALEAAFEAEKPQLEAAGRLDRAVLTRLLEGHASYRGIQACLKGLLGEQASAGRTVQQPAGRSVSECGGCAQCGGVGDDESSGGRWRELDAGVVGDARARTALADDGKFWRQSHRGSDADRGPDPAGPARCLACTACLPTGARPPGSPGGPTASASQDRSAASRAPRQGAEATGSSSNE